MKFLLSVSLIIGLTAPALGQDHEGHGSQKKSPTTVAAKFYSEDTKNLPEIKATEIVTLADGQTYELRAFPVKQKINGKWERRLSYNGMIPGPTLRVTQGSRVKITLKNDLPVDTTLHPHGLRVPNKFDGVPGVGQPPIKPGESYVYDLNFEDAGLYWYHPHIRDDYTVNAGLYGLFLVDPKDASLLPKVDQEIFLVLNDTGRTTKSRRFYENKATHTLMGRFGSIPFINGRTVPRAPSWHLAEGQTARFYVLNAANTRSFRVALDRSELKLVGSDGGFFETPESVAAVSMGPTERYTFDVTFTKAGLYSILNAKPKDPWVLGRIKVSKSTKPKPTAPAIATAASTDWAKVRGLDGKSPDFSVRLSMEMDHDALPMDHGGHGNKRDAASVSSPPSSDPFFYRGRTSGVEWDDDMAAMNEKSDSSNVTWKMIDAVDGKENMKINWPMKKERFYKIRIFNDPNSMHPMQHPIHFHGQHFAITSVNGVANPNLTWKDTVLVGAGDTVDIVLNATNAGVWMAHCHILEHIEAQMMMNFTVAD